jgi:3D (Asp-Asp-Asp) domain-containing protein
VNAALSALLFISIASSSVTFCVAQSSGIKANHLEIIAESAAVQCTIAANTASDILKRTAEVGDIFNVSCTAYTTERTDDKITATGTIAKVGTAAVDPRIIPYGTKMYIESADGSWIYGYAIAEDCGGGIKGNKIDLFFDTYDECIQFGVRKAVVYIIK